MRWITVVALCLTVATARAEDWGVTRDPFDPGVVRRYKAILVKDPHDAGALTTLLNLYKRYRKVETLEAEYRAELAKGETWQTLVVLARMPRPREDSVALWKRALALRPDDARGWLASGDMAIGAADAKTARDAYRKAATLLTENPKLKKVALGKLIGAARSASDWPSIDAAYVELIALSPKDGMLWLERGNAQLAASKYAAARDSFITAEGLLKTDPERRLLAAINQGVALERMGRLDEAMAQYEATLDKVPKGFYLAGEILPRIVDLERKRGRLLDAIAKLEKRWPEKQRGHFEWDYLGDLYKEAKDEPRALDAYKKAVAKAPTEVVTQRKLIALLEKLEPDQALAQHEKAAKLAPGDAELQIALAKRYQPIDQAKAIATLEKLAKRFPANINVRRTIAGLYEAWNEPRRAIVEYEAIANVEPKEPDHAIVLGEVLWRAGEQDRAKDAWKRLEKIGTADSHFKHAEALAIHEVWNEAETAYTRSLALDGRNENAWYGRARANDALAAYEKAASDARRAVALTGTSSHNEGERYRVLLVRILGHWYAAGDKASLTATLARWRFAFDRGDPVAGYLLAAHHARIGSLQQHEVLVALYKQVPTDDTLGMAVARSHVRRKEFGQAKAEYEKIAARDAKRAKDIAKLIAQVDEDAARWEIDSRGEEEGLSPSARRKPDGIDLVGRHRRLGYRMAVGSDVSGTGSALLGIGLYRQHRIARGTTLGIRAEWLQRDDAMEEVNTVAVGGTIATRLWDAQKFEIALGIGPRFEIRYGSEAADSSWDRAAITGDATLELLPRAIPATVGLRYNHTLTDSVSGSSLVFELGFELR